MANIQRTLPGVKPTIKSVDAGTDAAKTPKFPQSVSTQAALAVLAAADTNQDGQMTQAELNRYLIQQQKLLMTSRMTEEGYQAAVEQLRTAAFMRCHYSQLAKQDAIVSDGNTKTISVFDINTAAAKDGDATTLTASELRMKSPKPFPVD